MKTLRRNFTPSPIVCGSKLCSKRSELARLLPAITLVGATLGLAASPAHALTQFSGGYAPANWTQSVQGDGWVDTAGAPGSVTLNGADDGSGGSQSTDFTISAPSDGIVSFDWSYSSADLTGFWDPFGYLLNGNFVQIVNSGPPSQSGSFAFNVAKGDLFGFRQNSLDSGGGRASTTISNFTAPVPGPLPLLGAGTAWGLSRRLRKRIATPAITSRQA